MHKCTRAHVVDRSRTYSNILVSTLLCKQSKKTPVHSKITTALTVCFVTPTFCNCNLVDCACPYMKMDM